jgi:hypothetical protein
MLHVLSTPLFEAISALIVPIVRLHYFTIFLITKPFHIPLAQSPIALPVSHT